MKGLARLRRKNLRNKITELARLIRWRRIPAVRLLVRIFRGGER
jgi:hypothetical protein